MMAISLHCPTFRVAIPVNYPTFMVAMFVNYSTFMLAISLNYTIVMLAISLDYPHLYAGHIPELPPPLLWWLWPFFSLMYHYRVFKKVKK